MHLSFYQNSSNIYNSTKNKLIVFNIYTICVASFIAINPIKRVNYISCKEIVFKKEEIIQVIYPRLDLVNVVGKPFLFTKLSLFTKSSLNKE